MSLRGFRLNRSADLLDRRAAGSAGSATWPSQLSSADRGDLAELLPEYRAMHSMDLNQVPSSETGGGSWARRSRPPAYASSLFRRSSST
jgi:hypothetical protein